MSNSGCIAFCARLLFFSSKVQWSPISFWQEQPPLHSHCVWEQQLLRGPRGNVGLVRDRGTVSGCHHKPAGFELIWSSNSSLNAALEQVTRVWGIIKPRDFIGLWCSLTQRNLLTTESDVISYFSRRLIYQFHSQHNFRARIWKITTKILTDYIIVLLLLENHF